MFLAAINRQLDIKNKKQHKKRKKIFKIKRNR